LRGFPRIIPGASIRRKDDYPRVGVPDPFRIPGYQRKAGDGGMGADDEVRQE
jgi:hypothetical protein